MDPTELLRAADRHRAAGRLHEARQICSGVLRLAPNDANALHLLGVILLQDGDPQAAVPLVERAIKAQRGNAQFHRTMGMALRSLGDFEGAISHLRRALRLRADDYHSHAALGMALHAAGHFAESALSLRRALALNPAEPDAHFHLAIALLNAGDFERGWEEYEFRPARRELESKGLFRYAPEWRGEDLRGRTLLVHGEQGYGDSIQFARYVPLVAERGGKLVLVVRPELLPLFAGLPVAALLAAGSRLPPADFACALGSLPRIFGTRVDTIPAPIPYLAPPAERLERWRARMAGDGRARIGLVWAGSPTHSNDRNRSMPLAALAGIGAIPGLRLYSLQKGPAAAQLSGSGMAVEPLGDELADFADAAAALSQIDVLVSVDTSVVHLAGALGRPALLLLPAGLDWRWLIGRDDSPWYPTLRLVRQRTPGDWAGVVERVAAELTAGAAAVRRA